MSLKFVFCYFAFHLMFQFTEAFENDTDLDSTDEHFHQRMPQPFRFVNKDDGSDDETISLPTSRIAKAGSLKACCPCKKSYIIGRDKVTHPVASLLCQRVGMDLANIMSHEEEDALIAAWRKDGIHKDVKDKEERTLWLGGVRCAGCAAEFIWEATGKPIVYSDFQPGQPNNVGKNQNCLVLEYGATAFDASNPKNEFGWNDLPCGTNKKYACESRCCSN